MVASNAWILYFNFDRLPMMSSKWVQKTKLDQQKPYTLPSNPLCITYDVVQSFLWLKICKLYYFKFIVFPFLKLCFNKLNGAETKEVESKLVWNKENVFKAKINIHARI